MKTKSFITLLFLLISLNIVSFGQDPEPQKFEGTINAINFKNLDNKTIAFSSGIGYNGNEKITYSIKDNFILVSNHTLHYNTLWDSNTNSVTVWSDILKEGKIFKLNEYVDAFSAFTSKNRTFGLLWMKQTIPGYTYKFDNRIKIKTLGEDGYFQSGRIENPYSGADMEYAYCTKFLMPYNMTDAQVYGFNNTRNLLITKYRFTIDTRTITNKLKGYQGQEITELNPQTLDKSIFTIPDDIKLKKSGITGLHGFYKKLGKALKKNKLFPSTDEVTYELNENDWTY